MPVDPTRGVPLDAGVRRRFEGAFGALPPHVRIHDHEAADAVAREHGAAAWSYGPHVGFARGRYRPGTVGGDLLLAHELAHTVQQGGAVGPGPGDRVADERDAEVLAGHALAHLAGLEQGPRAPSTRSGQGLRLALCRDDGPERDTPTPAPTTPAPPTQTPAPPETPQQRRTRVFGADGHTFITGVETWLEGQSQEYRRRIEERLADYQRRNWAVTPETTREYQNRLDDLRGLDSAFDLEIDAVTAQGPQVLLLANVVYNEAGASNDAAKRAIAYAWLNRTGGAVREPVGAEISHYQPLQARWNGLSDTERLTFLRQFAPSVRAARQRLEDANPATNDPTGGATHWVSPRGLAAYDRRVHGADRYSRTVGTARNRAFPTWARDETSAGAAALQRSGAVGPDYDEFTVPGVPNTEFLFYRDVR